jgi:hypothetical protein
MTLSSNINGPCATLYFPVQFIAVGVADGILVAVGVIEGVNVIVGGSVLVGVRGNAVRIASYVALKVAVAVGETAFSSGVRVATFEGVGVSALNPVGNADPKIGTDIKKVRALAETTSSGSRFTIGRIGS